MLGICLLHADTVEVLDTCWTLNPDMGLDFIRALLLCGGDFSSRSSRLPVRHMDGMALLAHLSVPGTDSARPRGSGPSRIAGSDLLMSDEGLMAPCS